MRCIIYKSSRKDGAYVFPQERDDFARYRLRTQNPLAGCLLRWESS